MGVGCAYTLAEEITAVSESTVNLAAVQPLQQTGEVSIDRSPEKAPLDLGDVVCATGIGVRAGSELAAPRNYRLVHADALLQRARLWLRLPKPEARRARDDAEAAIGLAQFCNYAWGQRDATELLAAAYDLLGQPQESARYQTETDQWTRRLTRPG
jgi:hypothetical protein